MMPSFYDYMLAGVLILLGVLILRAKDLFVGVILFIIFGMFVALAWIQLKAPDIALVEVVIGSALTGALLLGSLAQIESRADHEPLIGRMTRHTYKALLGFLVLFLSGVCLKAVLEIQKYTNGLGGFVDSVLPQAGVKNPVTAVVLNIRGYDTLLEMGVLFIAVIAILLLNSIQPLKRSVADQKVGPVLTIFLDFLTPVMILMGAYLLWIGAYAPGGAFQAGAILAGVGILMLIRSDALLIVSKHKMLRIFYALGFFIFILIGFLGMANSQNFLTMTYAQAKTCIFIIEVAATISIAVTLMTLFAGCAGFIKRDTEASELKEEIS